ncbi:DNA-directed RNA polymerase subunit beta [candidate division TM6 bacterium RIFCSPHIGHO2_12_FULL_36_22]|nr:MAG: DNA-directed RNA polymerase subunit beta [candidate division TM6 bacterium RIFCSPHIGHO2_12_FULL_36_22]
MSDIGTQKHIVRKSFGKLKGIMSVPNLIEVQSKSFNDFVQLDYLPSERLPIGLAKVLQDTFPIEYEDKMSLEYVSYELGDWSCTCGKLTGIENRYTWTAPSGETGQSRLTSEQLKRGYRYISCPNCLSQVRLEMPIDVDECRSSGQTYSLPLRIKIQLVAWDIDQNGNKSVRDIKEQNIFFSEIPVMAALFERDDRFMLGDQGTFLINGVDRVVVSQLHRSPGVVFSRSKKVNDLRGRPYYLARIIPMRGSWMDFEFDNNDLLYVRIDKKKKILVTTFLQALGVPKEEIISLFYDFEHVYLDKGKLFKKIDKNLVGQRIEKGMLPEKFEAGLVGRRVNAEILKQLKDAKIDKLKIKEANLLNRVVSQDLLDPETGEILLSVGEVFSEDHLSLLKQHKELEFEFIAPFGSVLQPTIAMTLAHDTNNNADEALKELHAKLWPGDSSSLKEIKQRFENLLFSGRQYDLTKVGRIRMNRKLGLNINDEVTTLTREDIFATIKYLVNLRERGVGELDDIDHLGNRRVRLVGELLSNQVYIGFARIERIVHERFRLQDIHSTLMPQDLLNVKPLGAVIREFFGTGQLSQFMDQTNPLAELAHKRRLSALGPGGVLKDRATYEVRDVHTSHYGRICPIETPEGQTIGLISSLATYAMVDDLGFIETAYRPVVEGKVKDEIVFLDAFQEATKNIAQIDAFDQKKKELKKGSVLARHEGNFMYVDSSKIDYMDLSPKQLVSVAAALIPFLEHDDASRALMGANMQRQAVPLVRACVPLVGTGMEQEVSKASGAVVLAKRAGVVEYVSAEKIIIRADENSFDTTDDWISRGIDVYYLRNFKRSSYSTWIHQSPIVKRGDRVEKQDIISNGAGVTDGELALGTNLIVAFMPWHGYNFEDAIVLNKNLVANDTLTSVHIDEYSVEARDTKLGPEEITKDIPNVSEAALSALDEEGIIKIGARVQPGDIVVGKVTLKGDVQYSPEEKLLRAIFGEKSREVRDTSLRVPPGVEGTVVDVKVFSRSGIRKDKRYKDIVTQETAKLDAAFDKHLELIDNMIVDKAIELLANQPAGAKTSKSVLTEKGTFDAKALKKLSVLELIALKPKDKTLADEVTHLTQLRETQNRILTSQKEERINKLKKGDPLPSGVIKMVKVFIASKRPVSVGDKIAGRHGNKGVVSIIVPREDMPYLENGTPVDVVLNPLGVPSRMNVGQVLETILGFAGREVGEQLRVMLEKYSDVQVKKFLEKFYGTDYIETYEKDFGKKALAELAEKTAKSGMHFSTPVFDGASFESDIQPMLKELGLESSGSYKIKDGRTGNYLDQPVTVGGMYIMKLNHMVDDKLHARSVGPYSLVTQQPLGGKAQFGGQRFGEMEVWALEAYGAAYTLQEMLTYKSDDVIGRHKVYETIVHGDGDEIPDPGLPESFNVLIKELQSLALQVDLFKAGKEEVSE